MFLLEIFPVEIVERNFVELVAVKAVRVTTVNEIWKCLCYFFGLSQAILYVVLELYGLSPKHVYTIHHNSAKY